MFNSEKLMKAMRGVIKAVDVRGPEEEASAVAATEGQQEAEDTQEAESAQEAENTEEAERVPVASERDEFSVQSALDTPGFDEFLSQSQKAETLDMGDAEKIAELHATFERIPSVSEGIQDFLNTNEDFQSLGIDFKKGDFPDKFKEHISQMAHQSPEALADLSNIITEYTQTNEAVAEAEHGLEDEYGNILSAGQLTEKLYELHGRKAILSEAHEVSGFFARRFAGLNAAIENFLFKNCRSEALTHYRSKHDALLVVRESYNIDINPAAIEAAIEDTEQEIEIMANKVRVAEGLEKVRAETKAKIATDTQFISQVLLVNKDLQQLAWKQVETSIIRSVSDPDKAFEYIEQVRNSNVLRSIDAGRVDAQTTEWTRVIQEKVERTVSAEIEKALAHAKLGSNAFQNLQKSLSQFTETDRIGTKEGVEARTFVIGTLRSIAEKNKTTPQGRAKNILIQALIHSLSDTGTPEDAVAAAEAEDPELVAKLRLMEYSATAKVTETPVTTPPAPAAAERSVPLASAEAASGAPTTPPATPQATTSSDIPAEVVNQATETPATNNREQIVDVEASTVIDELVSFNEAQRLGGLPAVMEVIHEHELVADEVMQSSEFRTICTEILDGTWYNGQRPDDNFDTSVRHFTELMREFPPEVYEEIITSEAYIDAVTVELTTHVDGSPRWTEQIFGFQGIQQFPPQVREALITNEKFLDTVVESLLITRHSWDFNLMALCLTDIPIDFRDSVFNTPKFVQILSDFIGGSYRIKREGETVDDGIKKLSKILGARVLKNPQVQAAIAAARPAPARRDTTQQSAPAAAAPAVPTGSDAVARTNEQTERPVTSDEIVLRRNPAGTSAVGRSRRITRRDRILDDAIDIEATPVPETGTLPGTTLSIEENSQLGSNAPEQVNESVPAAEAETTQANERRPRSRGPRMRIPPTQEFSSLENMIEGKPMTPEESKRFDAQRRQKNREWQGEPQKPNDK